MKILAAALALAFLPGAASAQNGKEILTLADAVDLAVKNDPAALAAEQDIIIARQRVSEARFMAMPQLALSGTLSRVNLEYPEVLGAEMGDRFIAPSSRDAFYSVRAQALQPLYTGGRNTYMLKLAKTAQNQAKVNYETMKADAALAAKKAFYTLLYQRRLREVSEDWLKRAASLNDSVRKDTFEELEAAMLLSGLSDRARQSVQGEGSARAELLKALNKEPGSLADIAGEFEPIPVETGVDQSLVAAMETRPDLKSELYKAKMDDIVVTMAMIRRYPTIYLGASYDVNADQFSSLVDKTARSSNWLASLSIHFPLSYDIWTQVQQRKAQQRQGELKRAELQDKIRFEIITAHKDAVFWQEEAAKLRAEAEKMKTSYEAAARAARPSMPGLRALCALVELDRKYLDAVYSQLMARIRLEWAQGRDLPK